MSSVASEVVLELRGALHLVVHRGRHPQPGLPRLVDQPGAVGVGAVLLGQERVGERRLDARVGLLAGGQLLVGHQLGLHDQQRRAVEDLHLVADRRDRPLRERHHAHAADLHRAPGGRGPHDLAGERARLQVEHAFVVAQLAVAQIEGLVLHEEADQLAVGDVDDRLAGLGVAVAALRVRERPLLVERVEVGAGGGVRLAFIEVATQSDVPVGQGEHRLDLADRGHVQLRLAHVPRFDGERAPGIGTHRCSSRALRRGIGPGR